MRRRSEELSGEFQVSASWLATDRLGGSVGCRLGHVNLLRAVSPCRCELRCRLKARPGHVRQTRGLQAPAWRWMPGVAPMGGRSSWRRLHRRGCSWLDLDVSVDRCRRNRCAGVLDLELPGDRWVPPRSGLPVRCRGWPGS